jgi:hypothetical protein
LKALKNYLFTEEYYESFKNCRNFARSGDVVFLSLRALRIRAPDIRRAGINRRIKF